MKKKYYLKESESRLLELILEHQPAAMGELCGLTGELMGWRRLQTADVLRSLLDKGFCARTGRTVRAVITREQIDSIEGGGLTEFISTLAAGNVQAEKNNISGGE